MSHGPLRAAILTSTRHLASRCRTYFSLVNRKIVRTVAEPET